MSDWMTLRSWFRGPAPAARVAQRARLAIELLEDRAVPSASSDFRGIIGLDAVQAAYPYRGDGYSVAVLDTGINYNDPNLGGGWGKRVIAGYNFVNNTTDPLDDNGHGTFVAGEIGSSSLDYPGVAPGVNLIALKVLDANNNGSWANIDAALKWVIAHQAQYHIVAVNLSLGSGNYSTDPFNLVEPELATLKQNSIFTAVASGNNFAASGSTPGLAYPAVDADVVSVGTTWAGSYGSQTVYGMTDTTTAPNQLADFTQRNAKLSLLAPGAWINGEAYKGGYTRFGGTSMSTAVVTGAAVLLHQALDAAGQPGHANQAWLLGLMQATGTPIKDNNTGTTVTPTGLTFKQLNLKAALTAIAVPAVSAVPTSPPALAALADQTLAPGGTVTVALLASDPGSFPVTLTAQVVSRPALAYQLNQQLGLSTTGNYYLNWNGYNEKWLLDRFRNWYFILPDGEFRRFSGSMTASLLPANLVGQFDPTYYANPAKLWYTPYAAFPPLSVSIANNQLTIHSTSPGWTGATLVRITASNGTFAVTQTLTVNVALPPPLRATLVSLVVKHG